MFYPLRFKEVLILLGLLLLGYGFTVSQKYFIPEPVRPVVLFAAVVLIFISFFFMVRPESPARLSKFLSLLTGGIVLIIILIQHVIIRLDISYKAGVVLAASILAPFAAGLIYRARSRGSISMH